MSSTDRFGPVGSTVDLAMIIRLVELGMPTTFDHVRANGVWTDVHQARVAQRPEDDLVLRLGRSTPCGSHILDVTVRPCEDLPFYIVRYEAHESLQIEWGPLQRFVVIKGKAVRTQ